MLAESSTMLVAIVSAVVAVLAVILIVWMRKRKGGMMHSEENKPKLGKLEKGLQLRDIWPLETDFSAWLAGPDGLALLGETLGMELDEAETEKEVGRFSADVVCLDVDGVVVVVENQFGKTDHDHLGKLLTYSAGLKSTTLVWVVLEFVEEHRAALDWLNEHTARDVRFFGLELEVWKIGNSAPAPKFNVVSKPNDWTRTVRVANEGWPHAEKYWEGFLAVLNSGGKLQRRSNVKQKDKSMSFQKDNLSFVAAVTPSGNKIRAEIKIGGEMFEALTAEKDAIDQAGRRWEWKPPSGGKRKSGYVGAVKPDCDLDNESEWPEQHQWLNDQLESLYQEFHPRIKHLKDSGIPSESESEE